MAQAALKKAEVPQEPPRILVPEKNVHVKGVVSRDFTVIVPSQYKLEDLLKPEAWVHNASRFVKNTFLWCLHEKGEWSALLWVYDCTQHFARCRVMFHTDHTGDAVDSPDPENYEIKHVPNVGWSVINKINKSLLASGLSAEIEAKQFIERLLVQK